MHTPAQCLYLITMSSSKRDAEELIELEILHIQGSQNLLQCQLEGFFIDFQSCLQKIKNLERAYLKTRHGTN